MTTTINSPTEAIRRFDNLADWELIVIGDLRTPRNYRLDNGRYISPEFQEAYDLELSDSIGWNCIQRRNFGLLIAYETGADVVALVDDDNIPQPGWGENLFIGKKIEVSVYKTQLPVFDPVGATNYPHLWHRGFPLELVAIRDYSKKSLEPVLVDIQADFWNGDPDIDAVCRMEHAPECSFDPGCFPMASNAPAPFNSQNTFLSREVVPNYFLYPHIGRMDDIWAAYFVQALGKKVIFAAPSVYQARNEHDLIKDMIAEYRGYENNLGLVQSLAQSPENIISYLPERSVDALRAYSRHF